MKFLRLTVPALTIAFAGSAMAADFNTYRPGQVYAASPMPNADVCAMQCSGTAQCYGWNFLRSGNPDGSGICELNATSAAAVGHPYAVSGDNGGRTYGASNVVQGQSRTFRIGNPQAAMPAAPVMKARATPPPQRRNVPAPVVRKRTFAPAAPAAPRPQARRPQPKPAAAPAPQMTLTQQQAIQIAAKQKSAGRPAAPEARPMPASRARVQPAATPRIPAAAPRAPFAGAPMQARPAQSRAPQPAARAPMGGYPHTRPQAQRRPQQHPQMMQAPAPAPQPNLYGSLYDSPIADGPTSGQAVAAFGRRMARAKAATAPKSVTPPMLSETKLADPNAPVATAVPVKPVETSGLEMAGPAPQ